MARPEVSAIVLCYRAEAGIGRVIEPLYGLLNDEGVSFELVLVANYDRDREDSTPTIVERFASEHENVVTISDVKRGGMGWDMRGGFAAAAGEYMVAIDGDSQNPVEDVLEAYRRMRRTGVSVIKGRRTARFDGPYRRLISTVYNALFRITFRTRGLWDINAKPKGLTRAAWEQMDLRSDDWFIDAEIVLQAKRRGLSIGEFPVVFARNDERASFVRPWAILEFLGNMARARGRRGR